MGVFLLSETGHVGLRGAAYEQLVPLLDGRRGVEEIVAALEGTVPAAEVFYALERLRKKGYLVDASVPLAPEQAAFWELCGADPAVAARRLAETTVTVTAVASVDVGPILTQLASIGVRVVPTGGDRRIVITDDVLRPDLAAINAEALADGRPWMLVRPVGIEPWLGPIFVPGRTGCWACLTHRITGHRLLERRLSARKASVATGPQATPGPGAVRAPEPLGITRAALPSQVFALLGLAATEVAKWVVLGSNAALEGKVVTVHAATSERREHALTRRPQCAACGDPGLVADRQRRPVMLDAAVASFTADGGHRVGLPEETLARLDQHRSPITGIVGRLARLAEGLAVSYVANHNFAFMDDELSFLRKHQRAYSGGKGKSEAQAQMSAVGEAIERYSGVFQGDEARVRARLSDLGPAAVHPNAIMLFSERQLADRERVNQSGSPFNWVPAPFDARREIEWSPLWPILGGPARYAPTALCYFGYGRDAAPFARGDSNGCAAGATLEEAVYQGLMELCERDAVALWWYNRVRRPAVDLASFGDPYLADLEAHYASIHRSLWVLDLTSDLGIPTFVALSRRTDRRPEDILFGFGAHLDAKVALLRAATELNQFLPGAIRVSAEDPDGYDLTMEDAIRWLKTATLESEPYLAPDPVAPPRRLDDYPALSTGDLREDALRCARMLKEKGLETLVLDQTRPDTGLHVARVVVPGLRHFWARFAPGRLYDVPVQMGWLPRARREEELNPIPMFV
ncbi:MAG: TOMM precursor leader peptide-binding protein [Minicystis sp.]